MNKLLLLSGNDLPFIGGSSIIHQPKLKDIAFLGEDIFYLGSNFLCFSKDNLSEQDKNNLSNKTNFDILMSMINNTNDAVKASVSSAKLVLSLIFPDYQLTVMPNLLLLNKEMEDGSKQQCIINNDNFEEFKYIIKEMFCLATATGEDEYNPSDRKAAQIANKLKARRKKLNQMNSSSNKEISILNRYILILTLGNHHTIPQLMEYTVYQLFSQFKKFEKKYSYDTWFKAKLAGAEGLQDVENWLVDDVEAKSEIKPNSNIIEF